MIGKIRDLLRSRKFWAALVGVLGIIALDVFNVTLPSESIVSIALLIATWIFGQAKVDAAKASDGS